MYSLILYDTIAILVTPLMLRKSYYQTTFNSYRLGYKNNRTNMIVTPDSLPKRIIANLRPHIKMKGFVIGGIVLMVLFCFSSTVTFYQQQMGQ